MYILKNKFYKILIFVFDLTGSIMFLPFRIIPARPPKKIKKILLIRLDHIGDLVYSTFVFKHIKNNYPQARLDVLVNNSVKDLLNDDPYIDHIMTYNAPWFRRKNKKPIKVFEFFRLINVIKKEKYDIGIDLRGDLRHILLMFLSGIRFKTGYGITGGGFMLDKEITYNPRSHETEHNRDILQGIGIKSNNNNCRIYVSDKNIQFAQSFLKENNIVENDFIVCIHPGAGYASKRWIPAKWSELIRELINKFNAKIILIGSSEEKSLISNIVKSVPDTVIDASGKTSLIQLAAIISQAKLFIGTDSGPSHIAHALDVASVILYSGTNDTAQWAPKSDKVAIVTKDVPCKGCERQKCPNNICMDLIRVNEVMEKIRKVTGYR